MSRHVLILGRSALALSGSLLEAFKQFAPSLKAEQVESTSELLGRLAQPDCIAVVCWAERPEDLEGIVPIRRQVPGLPILILSSEPGPAFRSLALEKGATSVIQAPGNLPSLVAAIERAVDMRIAAREARSLAAQDRLQARGGRDPAQKPSTRIFRPSLLPQLVSDDPEQAVQMLRAFQRAGVAAPLSILRNADEAMAYLSGRAPYEDRARHPLPSLLLLDLNGDGKSGLSLLGWIRQQPRLQHLPVIMLSGSTNPEDIKRAYGVQANSYLIKPAGFEELVEMVKAINLYWSSLNVNAEP